MAIVAEQPKRHRPFGSKHLTDVDGFVYDE